MTTKQYLAALKKLGLGTHSNITVRLLGMSKRQLAYLASGESPIPEPVALLLAQYLKNGLPDGDDAGPSSASD